MVLVHALVPFEWGSIIVLGSPEGKVTGLAFDPGLYESTPGEDVRPESAQDPAVLGDESLCKGIVEELVRYFNGEKVQWSLAPDLTLETAFTRAVYERAMKVPYGETVTYGQVACDIGSPGGARAVGQAMSRNRFPLVIPCHRVVSGNGKIGGFSSGIDLKRFLLELEGVTL